MGAVHEDKNSPDWTLKEKLEPLWITAGPFITDPDTIQHQQKHKYKVGTHCKLSLASSDQTCGAFRLQKCLPDPDTVHTKASRARAPTAMPVKQKREE